MPPSFSSPVQVLNGATKPGCCTLLQQKRRGESKGSHNGQHSPCCVQNQRGSFNLGFGIPQPSLLGALLWLSAMVQHSILGSSQEEGFSQVNVKNINFICFLLFLCLLLKPSEGTNGFLKGKNKRWHGQGEKCSMKSRDPGDES